MDAALLSRFDALWLMERFSNTKALKTHCEGFINSTRVHLKNMEQASLLSDLAGWKFHAHGIKSTATAITARRIVTLCEEAESMLSLTPTDGMALIYHFEKELAILRSELYQLVAA